MNNNYDRGPVPNVEFSEETMSTSTRLLLLKSGETIVSGVRESMCGNKLTLKNPRTVSIDDVSETNTTVTFGDWMPLAQNRTFDISADYVVTSVEPLDSLFESYLENNNG